jgi:hypothetical protein
MGPLLRDYVWRANRGFDCLREWLERGLLVARNVVLDGRTGLMWFIE